MCILCVIQKWSRRVATMLPRLVIPLIGLWALSQLLPPDYRFEITSPRLACVFVLLVTLFWYEVLMPKLSAWRARRNALFRERKKCEAIELQKLRKTATRRCRNCLTPYRDQNPGGGRFMCSYCGHISKRPVLDLPVPPGFGISNSGIIKNLVGKGERILSGKAWSDHGWMCRQDWLENDNWTGRSVAGKSSYWHQNGSGIFGGDENCLAEKSYLGIVIFVCKLLTSFLMSIRWLLRKIFGFSSSGDASSNAEHRGILAMRGENGMNCHESRGEKARRKAEEKRQARLEKELLEEEERKQREEVARLVEERRRLKDEKIEAEKDQRKLSPPSREKDSKKEAVKKRQERRKEKDNGSSKSNSDAEELEKRKGKESDRKQDFERSEANSREHQKFGTDGVKGLSNESGHGIKNTSASSFSRSNAGTRYLDRMKGTFLSSSRAFGRSGFFGKTANSPAAVAKETKFNSSVDHVHISAHRRDISPPEHLSGKTTMNGDNKNFNRTVPSEPQPGTAPKKSWQQLFTRSSSASISSDVNVISRPNSKVQAEVQGPPLVGQSSSIQPFDNPINFVLPSPFTHPPYPNISSSSSLRFSPPIEPIFPHVVDGSHEFIPEEPEHFDDPCYVPDPLSLLGPVSESLDNFHLDLGTGFSSDMGLERSHAVKNLSVSSDVNKPSPIESPLLRLRIADEKHNGSNWFPATPNSHDLHNPPVSDVDGNEKGTWQMWNSSPLCQAGLGLVGGRWLVPTERDRSTQEDVLQPLSQKTMASLFTRDDQVPLGTHSPMKVFLSNSQNGGTSSPVTGSNDSDPWLQHAIFPPQSGSDVYSTLKSIEESTQNEMIYKSSSGAASSHPFELPPAPCWTKREWAVQGSGEGIGKSSVSRPNNNGGLLPGLDVQSLWSFDLERKEGLQFEVHNYPS